VNKIVNINGKFISNYIVCPTLCRACTHFLTERTTQGDYVCTAHLNNYSFNKTNSAFSLEHSSNSSYVSKERNECARFEDKYDAKMKLMEERQREQEKEDSRLRDEAENQRKRDDEKEREKQQEAEREQEWEEEEQREREEKEREEQKKAERRAKFERELEESRAWAQEKKEREDKKEEYNRTHCFYCGEQGFLVKFYRKHFHEKCLDEFKNKDTGKAWIVQEEKDKLYGEKFKKVDAIVEKYNEFFGISAEFRLLEEFTGTSAKNFEDFKEKVKDINIDNFSLFLEEKYKTTRAKSEAEAKAVEERERKVKEEAERVKEQERKEKEEAEREKREAEEQARILAEREAEQTKGKKRLQRRLKWPVFITAILITFGFGVFVDSAIQIVVLIIILALYYKLSTAWLNVVYDIIIEETEKGKKITKLSKCLNYLGVSAISTVIYFGILFLVGRFIFGIW